MLNSRILLGAGAKVCQKNVLKGSAKKKRKFVKTGDVQNYDPCKDNNISTNVSRKPFSGTSHLAYPSYTWSKEAPISGRILKGKK